MITAVNTLAICLYLLASCLLGLNLLKPGKPPKRSLIFSIGTIAVIAHGYSAINSVYFQQQIDFGVFRVSSLIFCLITAISLISILRRPTSNLLVALFPLAALTIIGSTLSSPVHQVSRDITAGLFSHILISMLAYSLISIATIQAIALALQERHLKHHHMGGILKALPPLQTMEQILFELIWVGTVLLTLSLLTGFVFLDDIFAQQLAHKTFFSISAWLIFAILLWGRHQLGWRSQTAARWTFGGFICLMLAYFGSKFVLELLLS
ncbi:MAG: ABC-type uncharacterized transport system permease subunit [Oceanicoccus sp.]|jgi:ABC-type uncharacterized transport system permease subunit